MKLLFVTQALDLDDPVLSAYHEWVREIGSHYDSVEVICLKKGRYNLPASFHVHSLGKEEGKQGPLVYAAHFLQLAWQLRSNYDAVFVHMNQEYVLIAGWLWKLLKKPVYLWRNHYAGSWLTSLAVAFCTKIFCTSTHSYTARYTKNVFMPVGVDTSRFKVATTPAPSNSILFLARMMPSKRPEMLLDALEQLSKEGVPYTADFYGPPTHEGEVYYQELKRRAQLLGGAINFHPGIPNDQTPGVYQSHEIFVNTSPSGMFDKTLFEAAASGCMVLAASDDWARLVGDEAAFSTAHELSERLKTVLAGSLAAHGTMRTILTTVAAANALTTLAAALAEEIQPS